VSQLGFLDGQLLGLSQKEILAFDTSKLNPAAVDQDYKFTKANKLLNKICLNY
jgi:hypothetical protein